MFIRSLALALFAQAAVTETGSPTPPRPYLPQVQAVASANFVLPPPRLRINGEVVRIEGTICRRANRSLISPSRLQVEHVSASGDIVDTRYAYVPRLSQRDDQRCGHYGLAIKPPFAPGDAIHVCLPRTGACAPPK